MLILAFSMFAAAFTICFLAYSKPRLLLLLAEGSEIVVTLWLLLLATLRLWLDGGLRQRFPLEESLRVLLKGKLRLAGAGRLSLRLSLRLWLRLEAWAFANDKLAAGEMFPDDKLAADEEPSSSNGDMVLEWTGVIAVVGDESFWLVIILLCLIFVDVGAGLLAQIE